MNDRFLEDYKDSEGLQGFPEILKILKDYRDICHSLRDYQPVVDPSGFASIFPINNKLHPQFNVTFMTTPTI